MKIVVTGAGGVLGRHIAGALAARGDEVLAVTSQDPKRARLMWSRHGAPDGGRSVTVVPTADGTSESTVCGADAVIDCAFPRAVGGHALADGMRFHAELFGAVERAGVGVVVEVSSQSVYDSARIVAAREGDPLRLDTPYATAKYSVELLADALLNETPHVHARLSSLIGVDLEQRLVHRFARRALSGESISITGGDQIFDFMDTRDAASALVSLVDVAGLRACEVINVGAGNPRTLRAIAETVVGVTRETTETATTIIINGGESTYVSSELDVGRLFGATGFTPAYSLEQTTADIVGLLRDRGDQGRC